MIWLGWSLMAVACSSGLAAPGGSPTSSGSWFAGGGRKRPLTSSAGGAGRIHRLWRRSSHGGPGREAGRASLPCGCGPASNGVDREGETFLEV